jgi:hypothetical protein
MQGLATRGASSLLALGSLMWLVTFQKYSRRIAESALMRSDCWVVVIGGWLSAVIACTFAFRAGYVIANCVRLRAINRSHAARVTGSNVLAMYSLACVR